MAAIRAVGKALPRWAWMVALAWLGLATSGVGDHVVLAQAPAPQTSAQTTDPVVLAEIVASARPDVPVMLTLANRDIVELRASVLGRSSADRAHTAELVLRQMAADDEPVQVALRAVGDASFVTVAGKDVFAILPADLDELAGETLDAKAQLAVAHLQQALDEMTEAHTPRRILRSVLYTAGFTLVFLAMLWILRRVDRSATAWLADLADRQLSNSKAAAAALMRQTRAVYFAQRAINVGSVLLVLIASYVWIGVVLRRFPYTRPWGDSLRGFFVEQIKWLALGVVHALPGLITVGLIAVATRLVIRVADLFLGAVERGNISVGYLYPDTVPPTRKLVRAALWMFALVVAYPFLPGSGTEAFKGISVFVGLLISLGSSGVVNQVMSGLTVTYSRALHVGDYVRVGDVEGTVTHVGTLATHVETIRREAVTIPNAVLISREVINYSKDADASAVAVPASVTIGYDTPWRQIHSLLLLAAERTPGIRREPKPTVVQEGLEDFYVKYTLWSCFDDPRQRVLTLADLYANIQDAFNEYGVQIMSPHYWADPHAPKVVPREGWAPPPAGTPRSPGLGGAGETG